MHDESFHRDLDHLLATLFEEFPHENGRDEEEPQADPITPGAHPAREYEGASEQPDAPYTRTIHVLVYDEPSEEIADEQAGATVESTLTPGEHAEHEAPTSPQSAILSSKRTRRAVPLVLGLLCCLLAATGAGALWFLLPLWTATATVTIIPTSTPVVTHATLTLSTDGTASSAGQVPGRLLPAISMSQAQTISTTGTGHQQAQAASGAITFYNAAPVAQTVPAGTVLTSSDGTQIVTEQDAFLPAAVMPTEAQARVLAHAVLSGPGGNIPARAIYGPCCRLNVFAQNTGAWTGGQSARTFPVVSAQDRDQAVSTLKESLTQGLQAALAAQVHPDETLLTPLSCASTVSLDHPVGAQATRLMVTLYDTCLGEVYRTQALHDVLSRRNTQDATRRLGTGVLLVNDIQITMVQPHSTGQQGVLHLVVTVTGTWATRFTHAQVQQMARRIAGTSQQHATSLLLSVPGVQQAAFDGSAPTTLPTDPSRIQVSVIYGTVLPAAG